MEFLKNKTTIALIIMILGVSYIGGIENNQSLDEPEENLISVNA